MDQGPRRAVILIGLRVTEAQSRKIDAFAEANSMTRSGAVRALVQRQLRWLEFDADRRRRGLGPYRHKRLTLTPDEADERAAELLAIAERKGIPNPSPAVVAFNILDRKAQEIGDGKAVRTALKSSRRALNQRAAERLERDMNADLERRAKVREDPPEAEG